MFKSTPILSLKEETLKKKDEFSDDFDIIFKNEHFLKLDTSSNSVFGMHYLAVFEAKHI